MKSVLFSALAIAALATSGCAIQSGASSNLCGQPTCAECTVMTGDCGCKERPRLKPEGGIFCNLCDREGMAMGVFDRGSACGKERGCGCNGGGCGATEMAAGGGCGCSIGDGVAMESAGDCGCGGVEIVEATEVTEATVVEPVVYQQGFGAAASGCSLRGGCRSGRGGLVGAGGHGGCLSGRCGAGGHLSGLAGSIPRPGAHPYGGAIPHTAQGPGAGTGMAPSYAYPYYTTRGPRDFLMKKPPSIGY